MIDVLAIATNGYISLDKKTFSIATDGYYPNEVVGTIIIPARQLKGNSGKHHAEYRNKMLYLQDEEDLAYILSIFLQKWG